MNNEATEQLNELLESELNDFGFEYKWEWCEDSQCFDVEIEPNYYPEESVLIQIKYEDEKLKIELSEDCWYEIRFWDSSIKYFWMKLSPLIWT